MNNEKELSLVVFGASGFTGRLVAEYLAAQYMSHIQISDPPRRIMV